MDAGDSCRMYLMPQNYTLNNGYNIKSYVMCILPQ